MNAAKVQTSSSPVTGPHGFKLAFAFETFVPKVGRNKKAKAPKQVTYTAADVDVRQCVLADRKMLSRGAKIAIFVDGVEVIKMHRPLFVATSSKTDLIADNEIKMVGVDQAAVYNICSYINGLLTQVRKGVRMPVKTLSIKDKLAILATSKVMGLDKYTDSVYKDLDYHMHNDLLDYPDLDALTNMAADHGRLLHIAAMNLAERSVFGEIPDPEDFKAYLVWNPMFGKKVKGMVRKLNKELNAGTWNGESRVQKK